MANVQTNLYNLSCFNYKTVHLLFIKIYNQDHLTHIIIDNNKPWLNQE